MTMFSVAVIPQPSVAKAGDKTGFGHFWAKCSARKKKPIHVVWMPGLVPMCLWGYPLDRKTQARSLKNCERFAPRAVRGKFKCVVAVKNGRIVDKRFAHAVSRSVSIPVKITIFDKETGKTQVTRGTVRDGKGPSLRKLPFNVYAGSARICSGTVAGGINVRFTGKCFGETFKGTSKRNKFVRSATGYSAVPDVVRLKSKGSFIEIDF
jgi:hypothetical protein